MGDIEFGKKLAELRKKAAFTQKQVAEYLGISNPSTVASWEGGKSEPSAANLMRICRLFEVENVLGAFGYGFVPQKTMFQSKRLEYLISATGKDDLTKLSAQAGVDVMTFTHWLTGQTQPPQDKVELLASFFGATSDYLMGLTDDPKGTVPKKEGSLSHEALHIAALFDTADDRDKETVRHVLGRYTGVEVAEELHPNTDKKVI